MNSLYCRLSLLMTVVACFISSLALQANPVSKAELIALGAKAFYQKALVIAPDALSSELKDYYFIEENESPVLAVLNFDNGFVVMSADDVASPVLAYGFDSQLSSLDMAPGARMWLSIYKEEILAMRRSGAAADDEVADEWSALRQNSPKAITEVVVPKLLRSKWNQTKYYNRYSPYDTAASSTYDDRTPNGCVAVAMAQIFYYYRYPSHGYGSHTNHTSYGSYFVDFANASYQYDMMQNELNWYNNEVAKLIFHCATSVDMNYAADGSGAYSFDVPNAISTYFGYSNDAEILYKNSYSNTQWRNILKASLDQAKPLYYSGYSDEGGHAFVCDGYNSDNHFHFNFGWGGYSDGFYALTSSSGSSTTPVGGYSGGQAAIRNFYPADEGYPYYCNSRTIVSSSGTLEDGSSIHNYADNMSCIYVLTEENADAFTVTFDFLKTQSGHDSLSFWDGNPASGHLLLTLSGEVAANTTYSFSTDSLYVTFITDDSVNDEGWFFAYTVHRNVPGCVSAQIHEASGTITDGSGPDTYRANSSCTWMFRVTDATYITFTVDSIDLSPEDELLIYDSHTLPRTLLASYTGNQIPAPLTINTSRAFVKFVSDNYINRGGFSLSWDSDGSLVNTDAVADYQSQQMSLSPNPAAQSVTIRFPSAGSSAQLSVYDLTGRLVAHPLRINPASESLEFDVSSLQNGVYFVVYQDESVVCKQKMIVDR